MGFIYSAGFKKDYKNLTRNEKDAVLKKLRLMSDNLKHPSLRIKKIKGTDSIFECSINMSIRLTWEYEGEDILLRAIGAHDKTLKNP